MDDEIIWITRGGKHIPIRQGDTNKYMNNFIRSKNQIPDYNGDDVKFAIENPNLLYYERLTDDQKRAIKEYTAGYGYGDSKIVNGYLNGTRQLSEGAIKEAEKKIKLLDSSITEPIKKDFYVYMGINRRGEYFKVGEILKNNGFTSTSLYREDTISFERAYGVKIKLKVGKGTKALYVGEDTSNYKNEHELLIERGHSTRITKVDKVYDENGIFKKYDIEAELM